MYFWSFSWRNTNTSVISSISTSGRGTKVGRAVSMRGSEQQFPLAQGPGRPSLLRAPDPPSWPLFPLVAPSTCADLAPPHSYSSESQGRKGCTCQVKQLLGLEETMRLTNTCEDGPLYPTEAGFLTWGPQAPTMPIAWLWRLCKPSEAENENDSQSRRGCPLSTFQPCF